MFNKKLTPQSNMKQQEMFNMLIDIFTPGSLVEEKTNKNGIKTDFQTRYGNYTVISKPLRQECVIKEGKSVIFEIYLGNDYSISTRGMYLKHLNLNSNQIEMIKSSLLYNPKFDMKHCFELKSSDAVEILTSFKKRDANVDNGLVKPGEIEDSAKKVKVHGNKGR